jgi:hypothetical protein
MGLLIALSEYLSLSSFIIAMTETVRVSEEDQQSVVENDVSESSSSKSKTRDSKYAEIESMNDIVKSPYEPNESAEVGEKVFDDMKALLEPKEDGSVYPEATRMFGMRLAESLVGANEQIGKSGMVYSPNWQEGKIRGVQCGWIPKALLLLCLHEQRFARANEAVLGGVIKDLGTCKIVKEAMEEWKMSEDYINLTTSGANFTFTRQKAASGKCEIFVARAYRCIKALKNTTIDVPLMKKIKACLSIMNAHVKVNHAAIAKREAEKEEELQAELEANQERLERKRASKRTRIELDIRSVPPVVNGNVSNGESALSNGSEAAYTDGGSGKSKKRRRKGREESLNVLVGMFEEQHKRMGETLAVLRNKLQEHKVATRQEVREEIRAELLQEMSKNGTRAPKP